MSATMSESTYIIIVIPAQKVNSHEVEREAPLGDAGIFMIESVLLHG